jgi:hypothetical protein
VKDLILDGMNINEILRLRLRVTTRKGVNKNHSGSALQALKERRRYEVS